MNAKHLLFALTLACAAGASTTTVTSPAVAANSDEPSAAQIVANVQAFYDRTQTFRAGFQQKYVVRATGTVKRSVGTVVFKKFGKMNWDYTNNGNRVVSDNQVIKIYEKDNKQMYVQSVEKGQQHRAALSFLLGDAKLRDVFRLRKLDAEKLRFKGGYVLEGQPKKRTAAFSRVLFYVDQGTFQVRRVLLIDAQGNTNRFDFANPRVNEKVEDTEFDFTPPEGTRIIRR